MIVVLTILLGVTATVGLFLTVSLGSPKEERETIDVDYEEVD